MNLTNKLFKRLFAVIAALALVFTVAACETGSPLDEALDGVSIVYSAGDTDVAVTQNVSLPTSFGDATITWTSSNQNVISNSGAVTRGFDNVTVTLTARVEVGDEVGTVSFTLTVLGFDADAMLDDVALTGTNISYDDTLELFVVTGNFTVPQAVDGFTINWESSAPNIVSTDGVVVIPEFGQPDALVTLTAAINGVELDFELVVKASTVAPDPDLIRLEQARTALLISGVSDGVLVDVDLPLFVGAEGSADRVSVSWSSSNPAVLADDGSVTRPAPGAGNVTVTMTATLSLNGKSVTKEFTLVVIEEVSATPTDSIADAIAKSINEDGNVVGFYANIPGVTILGIVADGVVVIDDTGIMFMFRADGSNLTIGEVYDVQGVTNNFFGGWQLSSGNGQPIVFIPSTEDATPFNPTVSNSVDDILGTTTIPGSGEFFTYTYYEVTAKVVVTDPNDRYGTFLADVTYTGDGSEFNVAPNSAQELNAWVIYYSSNYKELHAFDGLEVTLEVLLYSYRTDRTIFTGLFFGTAADVEVNLTDNETLDLVENIIEGNVSGDYIEDTTLDLPTTLFGATIVYTSNSPLLDVTTGALTMPADGQELVTLSAAITLNGATVNVDYDILVGEPSLITIAEARLEAPGTPVYVKGVVTSISYNTFFSNAAVYIQDGTAGMYLYRLTNSANIEVGDEIEVKGYTDVFNGLVQVKDVYEMSVLSSDNPVVAQKLESGVDPLTLQSQYIFVYGTLDATPAITGTNFNTSVSVTYGTDETMTIYVPAAGDFADATVRDAIVAKLNGLTAGDDVSIFGALGWFNSGQLYVTNPDQIFIGEYKELNDQESVAEDLKLLTLPSEITGAGTLTLPATGAFGSTITWTSSDDAVINPTTGAVTLPATGNVDVTLTATATKGAESDTQTFTIKVGIIVVDVADARAAALGDTVTVEVLITDMAKDDDGNVVAFAQDATAGIYLYKIPATLAGNLAVGDIVEITGQRAAFIGFVQLNNFSNLEIISSGNTVTANSVTDPTALAALSGSFVEVTGYLRQEYTGTPSDFFLETANGTFQLRLVSGSDQESSLRDSTQAMLVGVAAGTEITIQAGVGQIGSTIQLMMLNASNITVGTLGSEEDLLAIAIANTNLPKGGNIVSNVVLPTTAYFGTTIVWSTSDADFMTSDGTVTQSNDSDENVTLTYIATLGNETETGTIDFVVKMYVEPKVETFNGSNATTSYSNGTFTGDNGVTWTYVHARNEDSYGIDGTGIMLRRGDEPSSLSATITGGISSFAFDTRKAFTGNTDRVLKITIVDDSDVELFTYTTDVLNFGDGAQATIIEVSQAGLEIEGDFTIKIELVGTGNRQITIDNFSWTPYEAAVNPLDAAEEALKDSFNAGYDAQTTLTLPTELSGVTISYVSDNTLLDVTTGVLSMPTTGQETITLTATLTLGSESKDVVITILVGDGAAMSDADKVAADLLDLALPTEVLKDETLTLDALGTNGTAITWASSDDDVIDPTTGAVVIPVGGSVDITLTATSTSGSESDTREFVITVGYALSSVTEAREATNDTILTVQLTITDMAADSSGNVVAFGQDTGAGIYLSKIPAALATNLAVGDFVEVTAKRATNANLVQLVSFERLEIISSGNVVTPAAVTDPTTLPSLQGSFVEVIGYLRQEYTGTPSDFFLETANGTFQLRLVSSSDQESTLRNATQAMLLDVAAGTTITIKAGVGQFLTTTQLMMINASNITVGTLGSDDDLLPIAVANTTLPAASTEVTANLTLPTTTLFGTTITWTSDDDAVIAADGTVTRPTDADANVTLSYEFKLGDETSTGTIEYVVKLNDGSEVTYTETFTNLDLASTSSSYSSGSFTGDNGITWTYTGARGDFSLDGKAILLRGGSTLIANISGGISTFSIEFYDAFAGAAQVALYINNVLVETSVSHDGDDKIPVEFSVQGINISGDFELKLIGTAAQTVIDNLTWTSFETDLDKINAASIELSEKFDSGYDAQTTLTLPTELSGVTISYVSDNTLLDVTTGALSMPTTGQETVTLTATLTLGSESKDVDITILVGDGAAMSDADKVAADLLDLTLTNEVLKDDTLTLDALGTNGTAITWASSDDDVIDPTTGAVVIPVGGSDDITLTATSTSGSESDTREFVITVGYALSSVTEAREATNDTILTVQLTITDMAADSSGNVVAFGQDTGAGIYLSKIPAALATNLAVGDFVEVTAKRAVSNDLVQLVSFERLEIISSGNVVTPAAVTDPTTLSTLQGSFVEVTGYLRQEYTGTPSDFFLETANGTFQLRLVNFNDQESTLRNATQAMLLDVAAGTTITIKAGVGQFRSTIQLMMINASNITVGTLGSDDDLLPIAVANTTLPAASTQVSSDLTLPTTAILGATIAWTSSNDAVIADDGTVTRPTDADANVTLTYTYTLGTETSTGTIDFVVLKAVNLVYSTGFEVSEGFTTSTTYNNQTVRLDGPTDEQWGTYYGTAATTGAIADSVSMQMRWYTSAPANLGYLYTNFNLLNVASINFLAKSTNGVNVTVSISVDDGVTYIEDELFTLSGTTTSYTYNVDPAYQNQNIRVKFTLTLPSVNPSSNSILYIDNVEMVEVEPAT